MLGTRHLLYIFIFLIMIFVVGSVLYFLKLEQKKAKEAPILPTTTPSTISVPTITIEQYKLKVEQLEELKSLREEHLKEKEEKTKTLSPQEKVKVEHKEKIEQYNALQQKRIKAISQQKKEQLSAKDKKSAYQIAQENHQERVKQYNELKNLRELMRNYSP